MNVVITAPSLNEYENVSGVSSVVRSIVTYSAATHNYFHFRVGNKDGEAKRMGWFFTQVSLLPRLLWFIKKHHIDLVHLNTDFTKTSLLRDYVVLLFIRFSTGLPVLLHIHGGYFLMHPPRRKSFFGIIITKMLRQADEVLVLSEIEKKQLLADYETICRILPNAVAPLNGLSPGKDFPRKIKFIFLGRIVVSKGIYLIVDAMKQLSDFYRDFSFTLYGAGPELQVLLDRLDGIEGLDYTYGGIIRGGEKWAALEAANVFLLPSLYGEGLPVAMLEAMQCGCIPVVSDDASITTVVQHAKNGFVVKKGEIGALLETLQGLLVNRDSLGSMSEAAKDTITENYGLSKYMSTLEAVYSSVAANE